MGETVDHVTARREKAESSMRGVRERRRERGRRGRLRKACQGQLMGSSVRMMLNTLFVGDVKPDSEKGIVRGRKGGRVLA